MFWLKLFYRFFDVLFVNLSINFYLIEHNAVAIIVLMK